LILVPHRDLHRFPLHALFSEKFEITYLPSLQMGLSLQKVQRDETAKPSLLSVEAPNSEGLSPLYFASFESAVISQHFSSHKCLQQDAATKEQVEIELANSYNAFHFAGHGLYNFHDPKSSELALANTDRLTLAEIRQQNLSQYELVTLSACETAITGNQTITTEYVGLVSGFLSMGVSHVVSTLWTVESAASALVMIEFYRRWQTGKSKAKALAEAADWLRSLRAGQLQEWYKALLSQMPPEDGLRPFIKEELRRTGKIEKDKKLYEHPYYWAAFIITGNIESS
jgi:CHAT domain-containing protein